MKAITQISLVLATVVALTAVSGCVGARTDYKPHKGVYRDIHDYYPPEKKEQRQPEQADTVESGTEL